MPNFSAARSGRPSAKSRCYAALAAILLLASPAPVPAHENSGRTAPLLPGSPAPAPAPRLAADLAPAPAPAPARAGSLPDIQVHTELPIVNWLRPGEFAWNDEGVPAGPTTVVVNIRARVLSVYRAGFEIGRSSILYGANEKPTPIGTFPILEKDAVHFSNIYDGAPMPHMMRLTLDGVAIHGASAMADNYATRGCIGLPREFAALLFKAARVGDRVTIWKGDRLPAA